MAITGIDTIEGKQIIAAGAVSAKSAEMAYNDENGNPITGYQVAGDYYSASNPSGFITGVDLTPYQTVEGMTAYQPTGDYLTTGDSANFYTTANESGFISEVPAGTMNESAFEYDENDKISGYNGSAFAGGSDVPEGVMVESGLEYNAVNEISGYNGSAIAQYGAEKQWLVHDDTLVHAANSAQYALGVNLSAVAQLLGVDETVLLNNNYVNEETQTFTLPEPLSNFKRIRVAGLQYNATLCEYEFPAPSGNENISVLMHYYCPNGDNAPYQVRMGAYNTTNGLTYNAVYGKFLYCTNTGLTAMGGNTTARPSIQKIWGIGRKEV